MSLVTSGLSLTQLCDVERDANAGTNDGWGNPLPPDWEPHLTGLPCRGWTAGHNTVSKDGTLTVLNEIHLLVQLETDVAVGDRVVGVSERGTVLYEGPLAIHGVLLRRDQLELILSQAA